MNAEKNEYAIRCSNLNKFFNTGFFPKPVQALDNLSFEVPEGRVTGFLGPNGSGKSTFLKIAAEFVKPTDGQVTFFNGKSFTEIKHLVGFVPERPTYADHFTGKQILDLHSKLGTRYFSGKDVNVGREERVKEVVELVGLGHAIDRGFGTYSKGMKQRLAIAQALICDPKLLILDEPLSGLDPDGREALINVILGFSKKPGKTVILSSHLLEDLQRICNYLIVINKGKLLFAGDPDSVFKPEKFFVTYRKNGDLIKVETQAQELNQDLKTLLADASVSIQSVEPETQAISSLYFDLTREANL